MTKLPKTLATIRETLLRLLPPELFDEHLTWIHWAQYEALRAKQRVAFSSVTTAEKRRVLAKAQELLTPLSANPPKCRRQRWMNPEYCPRTPYGAYSWDFHVVMVQELLWAFPEFVAGYRFGRREAEPYRDANPYEAEPSRCRSWDTGYILGLADLAGVREWLKERAEPE